MTMRSFRWAQRLSAGTMTFKACSIHYTHLVKDRVSDYGRDDSGNELAVGELIEAIPKKTSEYFRYGCLLNETYGNAVIHTNGDVKLDGRNVTHMEFRLCALLKAFVQEEAWW